jgi:hypothetical protein
VVIGRAVAGILVLASMLVAVSGTGVALSPSAGATSTVSQMRGFDTRNAPSRAAMKAWWEDSPYFDVGLYFGGANRSCSNSRITSSYIKDLQGAGGYGMAWGIIFIYVGRQLPNPTCQTKHAYSAYISTTASEAYSQGYSSAQTAHNELQNLGVDLTSTPIVLDLEAPIPASGSCATIAKQYVEGWDAYLRASPPQNPGLYTSSGGGNINQFTGAPVPGFVWFAEQVGSGDPNVNHSSHLSSSYWVAHQRHKQYKLDVSQTFGGYTLDIDKDCSDGPVYWSSARFDSSSPCVS